MTTVESQQRIHGKCRKSTVNSWQVSKVDSEFMASIESRQGIHCKHRKSTALRGKRRKSTANNERAPVSGLRLLDIGLLLLSVTCNPHGNSASESKHSNQVKFPQIHRLLSSRIILNYSRY